MTTTQLGCVVLETLTALEFSESDRLKNSVTLLQEVVDRLTSRSLEPVDLTLFFNSSRSLKSTKPHCQQVVIVTNRVSLDSFGPSGVSNVIADGFPHPRIQESVLSNM